MPCLCVLRFHSIHARPMQGFCQVHWIYVCERMLACLLLYPYTYIRVRVNVFVCVRVYNM